MGQGVAVPASIGHLSGGLRQSLEPRQPREGGPWRETPAQVFSSYRSVLKSTSRPRRQRQISMITSLGSHYSLGTAWRAYSFQAPFTCKAFLLS